MKAINCTQCGATIENVSERSVIINCDYCGARIMLDQRPVHVRQTSSDTPNFEVSSPSSDPMKLIGLIVGGVFLIPFLIAAVVWINVPDESVPSKVYSAPATPYAYPTPSSWTVPAGVTEKPIPVVNYQPRISWDGPNDLEHFESPTVDISSVSHLSTEEVKNTVFKNRIVKLRVVINPDGEIDDVETISGHPLLVEAATASAKSSIFRSRSKPTTRVLTYTFRVLKD
jgi:DNA-directed RNA polymerase subunit RPC12/RpoP